MAIETVTEEPEVLAHRQKIGSLIKSLLRSNSAEEADLGDALTMSAAASTGALQKDYGLSPLEARHWEFIRKHCRQAGGINNLGSTR